MAGAPRLQRRLQSYEGGVNHSLRVAYGYPEVCLDLLLVAAVRLVVWTRSLVGSWQWAQSRLRGAHLEEA